MRDTSCIVFPIAENAIFEQPVVQHLISRSLFQVPSLSAQLLYLVARRFTCRVAGKALPACFQKLFRRFVIEALAKPATYVFCVVSGAGRKVIMSINDRAAIFSMRH